MRYFGYFLLLLVLPVSVQGRNLYFQPRLEVNPVGSTAWEVIESGGEGARGIWCAAADYVLRRNPNVRGRLYVLAPRGPARTRPGAIGVTFTMSPDAEMKNFPGSYSVSVRAAGENLPVQHAYAFCDDYLYELKEHF